MHTPAFRVSVSYAAMFAALGSFFPFATLYLQTSGWSGTSIGIYSAVTPLVALLAQPMWGLAGDTMGDVRRLFCILMAISASVLAIFGFLPVTGVFFLLAVLLGLFQAPLHPIMDSLAVSTLGEGRREIGRTRVWGSVSFAVMSMVVGLVFDIEPRSIFWIYATFGLFVIAAVHSLPRTSTRAEGPKFELGGLSRIMSRKMALFLGCVFIMQLGHATALSFLSIVMVQRGASSAFVGYAWSLTAVIEIPVFLASAYFLRRFGPERLLVFSAFYSAIRLFAFNAAPTPMLMVITHSLDGIAFPLMLVSAILIVFDMVPEDLKTTGQTPYAAVANTLPRLLGSLIGGRLLDLAGASTLYTICGIVTLFGAFCLLAWQRSHAPRTEGV